MIKKRSCDRCGECCLQGGPALHTQDVQLLKEKKLQLSDLVTVRKGELAFQPMATRPEPVTLEFLKLQGKQGSWSCTFYNAPQKRCTIYEKRPLACRVLECTAPEALLAITGKNLVTRFDCIKPNDPLLPVVEEHEANCPCPDLHGLQRSLQAGSPEQEIMDELVDAVNLDLKYRSMAASAFRLSLGQELFYFGRPLFQLLAPLGITAFQQEGQLGLKFRQLA